MPALQTNQTSRREQILYAAGCCFAAHGFEGASTRVIASMAGVKQPLVYYHFGSKADLYLAAVMDELQRLHARLTALLTSQMTVLARMQTFVQVYCDGFTVTKPGLAVTLRDMDGLPVECAQRITKAHDALVTDALVAILDEGIAAGILRPLDARICAIALIGMLRTFLRRPDHEPGFSTPGATPIQVLQALAVGALFRPEALAEPVLQGERRPRPLPRSRAARSVSLAIRAEKRRPAPDRRRRGARHAGVTAAHRSGMSANDRQRRGWDRRAL